MTREHGCHLISITVFAYLGLFPVLITLHPEWASLLFCLPWILVAVPALRKKPLRSIPFGPPEILAVLVLAGYTTAMVVNRKEIVLFDAFFRLFMLLEAFLFYLSLRIVLAGDPQEGESRGAISLRRALVFALLAAVCFHASAGVAHLLMRRDYRLSAFMGNPNYFAALCSALFCFLLPLTERRPRLFIGRYGRGAAFLLLPVLVLLVLATRSRGGFIALLVVTTGYMLSAGGLRRTLRVLVPLLLLLLLVPNPLLDRWTRLHESTDQFPRDFIMRVSLSSLAEHPLGLGPNMAKYDFPAQAFEMEAFSKLVFKRRRDPTHNVLLETALDGGIAGASALLGLILYLAARARRSWRTLRGDPVALGSGMGLLVLVFHAQVDSIDRSHVLLLLAAVFLALHLGGGRTDQGPARRRIPYPRAIVVVPALGLLLLLQLAGPVSEILRRAAVPAEISPGRRSAYIQAARVICPWNYHVEEQCFDREWDNLRRTKRRTAFEAAERHLRRALRLNPRDPGLHRKLGRFYATLPPAFAKSLPGLKDRIRQAFHEADRLDPLNVVGRYNGLVKIYYPDHPQAFLRKAAILHRLPCGFARLDLMEGLCYQKTGDPAAALDRFRRARAHYEASRRALERLPRGSLIRAFHGFNVSGFPLDTIQQKIDSLEHALQEPKRERSQRKP